MTRESLEGGVSHPYDTGIMYRPLTRLFSLPVRKNSHGNETNCNGVHWSVIDGKYHSSFFVVHENTNLDLHTDHLPAISPLKLPEMHTFPVIQYRVWHYTDTMLTRSLLPQRAAYSLNAEIRVRWRFNLSGLGASSNKSLAREYLNRLHAGNQMIVT